MAEFSFFYMEAQKLPLLYHLSFKSDPPRLILSLHSDLLTAIKHFVPLDQVLPLITPDEFSLDANHFGFKKVFSFIEQKSEYYLYQAELKPTVELTEQICPDCLGTGIDEYFGNKCRRCRGLKNERKFDQSQITAICQTLYAVQKIPWVMESWPNTTYEQIFIFSNSPTNGRDQSDLHVEINPLGVVELREQSIDTNFILSQIKIAQTILEPFFPCSGLRCEYINNRGFMFAVPGDAFFLDGLYQNHSKSILGLEMHTHNPDDLEGQLLLFIGLAVLSDLLFQQIYHRSFSS